MKKLYKTLVASLIFVFLSCDNNSPSEVLIYEREGLSGLVRSDGQVITEPTYRYIFPSSDGIFMVSQEGNFDTGYIDSDGRSITDLIYGSSSREFQEGYASVQTNKCVKTDASFWNSGLTSSEYCLTGYINRAGYFAIPPIFHEAGDFSEGTANVAILVRFPKPQLHWGIINKSGTFVINLSSDRYYRNFSSGIAAFSDNNSGLYGYINKNEEIIAPPVYDFAFDFTGNHALVEKKYEYAVLKNDGSYLFPFDGYSASGPDFEGTIRISNKLHKITIYRDGKIEYNSLTDFLLTYLRRIYIIIFLGLKPT